MRFLIFRHTCLVKYLISQVSFKFALCTNPIMEFL